MEGLLHQGSADCDSWRESFLVGGRLTRCHHLSYPVNCYVNHHQKRNTMIPHFVDPTEVSPIIPAEAAMIHAGSEVYKSDADSPVRFNLYAVPTSDTPGACGDISAGMSSWMWYSLKNVCDYVVDSEATLDLVSVHSEFR